MPSKASFTCFTQITSNISMKLSSISLSLFVITYTILAILPVPMELYMILVLENRVFIRLCSTRIQCSRSKKEWSTSSKGGEGRLFFWFEMAVPKILSITSISVEFWSTISNTPILELTLLQENTYFMLRYNQQFNTKTFQRKSISSLFQHIPYSSNNLFRLIIQICWKKLS